jgi:hypothetical protein
VQVSDGRQMRSQASAIADRLTPARIDKLVDMAPFADTQMREEVRQSLKDRVGWMRRFGEGDENLPEPLEGASARTAMDKWQSKLDPSPEEHNAVEDFVGDAKLRGAVQTHLRDGRPKHEASPEMQQTVKHLDKLLRGARTDDDLTVYRPVDPKLFGDLEELPGRHAARRRLLPGDHPVR